LLAGVEALTWESNSLPKGPGIGGFSAVPEIIENGVRRG